MQRQPRIEDPAYLAYVRTLPCLACGKAGPSDAAHLRSAARQYGKRQTGMGEKPGDNWVTPLCRPCHIKQHSMNELVFWEIVGVPDPFALAISLYDNRPVATKPRERKKFHGRHVKTERKAKPKRPVGKNAPMPGTKASGIKRRMNGTTERRPA